jgi:hypothetical protein
MEDKIFGPLTFKQFLYVAGGAAVGFIMWSFLPPFFALIIGLPVVIFFMMAAFYKFNGRPFLHTVESFFKFTFSKKLYLWKRRDKKPKVGDRAEAKTPEVALPKLSQSKLKDLTWGLDIHENLVAPNKVKDKR